MLAAVFLISATVSKCQAENDGVTKLVRPGPERNVIEVNELGEPCYASAAISNGRIFVRAEKHLYCIAVPH